MLGVPVKRGGRGSHGNAETVSELYRSSSEEDAPQSSKLVVRKLSRIVTTTAKETNGGGIRRTSTDTAIAGQSL